ncbi:MAG: YdcF family protein [Rhodobacter sp.]|nr:YdcF family protein [Rhodobacter sp.]
MTDGAVATPGSRLMRWLRRLVWIGVAGYLALLATLLGFIEFYDPPADLPSDATLVVLGAGQRPDGALGPASRARLEAALALYHAGIGQKLVVSGGRLRHETRSIGGMMAETALDAGVPEGAVLVDGDALSTLQNALFTADLLGSAAEGPLILVSQRFHLPRSWLSFHWAGMHDLTLYPADTPDEHWQRGGLRQVWHESVKTPLNAIRAAGASAADLIGVPEARYLPLLD